MSATDSSRVLLALFHGVAMASAYGTDHEMAARAIAELAQALAARGVPCSIQLVEGAGYVDRELIVVDAANYTKVVRLCRAFSNAGYQELGIDAMPDHDQLSKICQALASGLKAKTSAVEELTLPGITWREITSVDFDGGSAEAVDEEVFAMTHLAMAMADAERIEAATADGAAWPWSDGLSVVRRLERGLCVDAPAVMRGLELSPGPWSTARRSVSVARCAQHLLGVVGCSTSLSRAVGHAAVAVAFDGLASSRPVAEAAARLLSQFDSGPDDDTASETTPHRLRMVTVVRALASQQNGELDSIHKLVATAYGLEALRLKIRPGHVAPRIEVLAVGMEQLDTAWMKLIINVEGLLPPGSRVQLPDGRAALVLGAGDPINPWRPLVLCEGRVLVPDSAVRIP